MFHGQKIIWPTKEAKMFLVHIQIQVCPSPPQEIKRFVSKFICSCNLRNGIPSLLKSLRGRVSVSVDERFSFVVVHMISFCLKCAKVRASQSTILLIHMYMKPFFNVGALDACIATFLKYTSLHNVMMWTTVYKTKYEQDLFSFPPFCQKKFLKFILW